MVKRNSNGVVQSKQQMTKPFFSFNGDYVCRKRVTDSWNKLTVGDAHWTLCKQKQTSALDATNIDRNTSKRLFGPAFYSK